jgi:hypothetical protein
MLCLVSVWLQAEIGFMAVNAKRKAAEIKIFFSFDNSNLLIFQNETPNLVYSVIK